MSHVNTGLSAICASVIAALLTALPAAAQNSAPLKPENAQPAIAVTWKDAQGAAHALDAKAAKLTAVHFWATWCVPCVGELPEVDATQAAYKDKGLHIVALSLDTNMDKVKKFFADHKITNLQPNLDPNAGTFQNSKSPGLPTTLFIDAQGNEIARAEGPLDWKTEGKAFIEDRLK